MAANWFCSCWVHIILISRANIVILSSEKFKKRLQICLILALERASLGVVKGLSIERKVLSLQNSTYLGVSDLSYCKMPPVSRECNSNVMISKCS